MIIITIMYCITVLFVPTWDLLRDVLVAHVPLKK